MARRTYGRTLCHSVNEGSEMELGGKFWLLFIGGAIACALAGLLLFILIGNAWARWGFFGMFLFLAVVSLAIGWIFDRKNKRTYDTVGDAG
jgi:membrane protein implicated in regulation of membrane protease activity